MIRRRYPAALGLGAALLGVLSAASYTTWGDLSAQITELFTSGAPVDDETYAEYAEMQALGSALSGLVTPGLLAALIAVIAALVLLVLRSRATVRPPASER